MSDSTPPTLVYPLFRVGQGWDSHALVAGRKLILGGVEIAHATGLLGHSDADALLHAVIDALLGAAGLGDIGQHFPDHEPTYKNADSMELLRQTRRLLAAHNFRIGNVDSTIVAQAPKLAPYIVEMRQNIALALEIAVDQVNVKAKTAEKLGPVGAGLSMEAQACVLIF